MSVEIVFAAIPYIDTPEPVMAPGYLKAIAEKAGFKAMAMDLNVDFLNRIKNHPRKQELIDFSFAEAPLPGIEQDIAEEINLQVAKILSCKPKRVGLSLLTYHSQRFGKWVAVRLKQLAPEVEIVIGGSGIKNFIADHKNLYCEELKNLGIIDHYIMGDGEFAVVEYLKGNFDYIGIDTEKWVQPTNLAQFPTPNYDDYEWDAYESKALPLVDSQGCVRACEFCDIIEHWTKYTYKPAEHIFNEMLELSRRHKIYRFSMRDSLINGNMKEFKKWVTMVADYNNTQPPETQFEWAGFAIVREATHHPEAIWEKIGQSRGTMLLGVESVIQRVRWELGKKFSNEAIDYHLDMARKYKVKLVLMMMCALPGETLEDYEFIKQWFKDRVGYARDPVYRISLSLAAIVPGTEWYRTAQEKSIELGDYPVIWMNKNLGITEEARLKHWKEVRELLTPFNSEKNRDPKSRQKGTLTVLKTDMDSIHI